MASILSRTCSIVFGVELELLVRPGALLMPNLVSAGWDTTAQAHTPGQNSKTASKNREVLRHVLTGTLTDHNIPTNTATNNAQKWSVVDDASILEFGEFWRVEIVSKPLSSSEDWQQSIHAVFDVLDKFCEIVVSKDCSMHVHVSPSIKTEGGYTLEELKRISKAIFYFDDAITKIMPAGRKNNKYAPANGQAQETLGSLRTAYQEVSTSSWTTLFQIIDGIRMRFALPMVVAPVKCLSWNFLHISELCGTVEFRRPPGAATAEEAIHWAGLTIAFVRQAMNHDWVPYQSKVEYPTVDELRNFILEGFHSLEPACHNAINFNRIVENTDSPTLLSTTEFEQVIRMKRTEKGHQCPFITKADLAYGSDSPSQAPSSDGDSSRSSMDALSDAMEVLCIQKED
ncbi:hypothetical protein PT974_07740 [Cladobotryum mycophilum]|uniref:Amidoligase n=1 Tax=Cladobotryum mycophilum TaxID=491253 RepID=A0ABR0SHR0_9HYPO